LSGSLAVPAHGAAPKATRPDIRPGPPGGPPDERLCRNVGLDTAAALARGKKRCDGPKTWADVNPPDNGKPGFTLLAFRHLCIMNLMNNNGSQDKSPAWIHNPGTNCEIQHIHAVPGAT